MSIFRMIFTLILGLLFSFCSSPNKDEQNSSSTQSTVPYDFSNPSKTIELPKELREISGIAIIDDHTIACVADEKGFIYLFDTNKETIVKKIKFSTSGDYEDLVFINDTYYVLRSDGVIIEYVNGKSKEHSTFLSKYNNTEGLAFDKSTRNFIITCKENPRDVFEFKEGTFESSKEPLFQITAKGFNPTAITIHPSTNNFFILAGNGQFGIFDRKGNIIAIEKLDKKTFPQPEGMALTEKGDIWISNEGKNGVGTLLLFKKNE